MKSNKFLTTLALLVILAAGLAVWRHFSGSRANLRPSAAAGEVLADEVGRLLGGPGKVVILSRQTSMKELDATGQSVASFTAALQHRSSVKPVIESAPRAPAGVMDLGAITSEQLLAAMEKNSDAKVVVVFAGLPAYSPALTARLTARSVKLVAVCGYGPTLRRWLESKAVVLAVVPRFDDPPAGAPAPKTAKDWFDRELQLLTPESLAHLPF